MEIIPRNPRIPWVWTPLLGEEEGGQPSGDLEAWKGALSPWQLNGFSQSKQASSREYGLGRELKMLVVPCTAADRPLQCNIQLHWTGHAAASFTRCCCCGDGFRSPTTNVQCSGPLQTADIRRSGT